MMSTKWTFSFLTLMLVGLLVAAPTVLANEIKLRFHDANHAGDADPADVSAEDGIQVLAGTDGSIRLDSAEPLLSADVVAGNFEAIGATLGTAVASEGNKRFVIPLTSTANTNGTEVTIFAVPKKFTSATTGDKDSTGVSLKFKYVSPDAATGDVDVPNPPMVVSITRATAIGSTIDSAFIEEVVSGEFLVKIVLTEKPNGGLSSAKLADRIKALSVSAGAATDVRAGIAVERGTGDNPLPLAEGGYDGTTPIPEPTGRDAKYYPYIATIVPDGSKDTVVIQVNDFSDLVLTQGEGANAVLPGKYTKPPVKAATNGRDKLEVKVEKDPAAAKEAGLSVGIPNDTIIPAAGYLIVAKDDGEGDDNDEKRTDSTAIVYPGDAKDAEILVGDRQPHNGCTT